MGACFVCEKTQKSTRSSDLVVKTGGYATELNIEFKKDKKYESSKELLFDKEYKEKSTQKLFSVYFDERLLTTMKLNLGAKLDEIREEIMEFMMEDKHDKRNINNYAFYRGNDSLVEFKNEGSITLSSLKCVYLGKTYKLSLKESKQQNKISLNRAFKRIYNKSISPFFTLSEVKLLNFSDKKEKKRLKANNFAKGGYSSVNVFKYLSTDIAQKVMIDYNELYFEREFYYTYTLKNPYAPTLISVEPQYIKKYTLLLEFIKGNTLEILLNEGTIVKEKSLESQIKNLCFLIDLSKSLEFLHRGKVIHRDVKPSNIIIDGNLNAKLLDFGISKRINNSKTKTLTAKRGTLLYEPPENYTSYLSNFGKELKNNELTMEKTPPRAFRNRSLSKESTNEISCNSFENLESNKIKVEISTKFDVWSFGLILSFVFSGKRPWEDKDANQILFHLLNKTPFPIPNEIKDSHLLDLIRQCTEILPNNRCSISSAKNKLESVLSKKLQMLLKDTKDRKALTRNNTDYLFALKVKNLLLNIKNIRT